MVRHSKKRIVVIVAMCLLLPVTFYGLFVLYLFIIAPLTGGFQAYVPATLPHGVKVTGHKTQQALYYGNKNVNIRTSEPTFYINENKISLNEVSVYACGKDPQCHTYTSPKGQRYYVTISDNEDGIPSLDTISWIRGKTLITITIEDSAAIAYINTNWGTTIDNFRPVNYGFGRGSVVRERGV